MVKLRRVLGGEATIEVVRLEIFGAETVVSRFSRGQESHGQPDVSDEEFNTFTVTAAEVGANVQYRLQTNVHALPCTRTALRDIRVDLIKEK
jgi:hypothetical protein